MGYILRVIIRTVWSLTVGLLLFPIGTVLFLLNDIFVPSSDRGFRILVNFLKWGSGQWFTNLNLRVETDNYTVEAHKTRPERPNTGDDA
jgi:hypothetical protein